MTNEAGMVAALQVRDAVFSYPRRGSDPGFSLRVRDLRVQAGEQVLIASPSGSGKSTLLHLIAGLLEVSSGSVEVCGQRVHDLRGATRDRFRGRTIGMIFQTFHLLEGFSAEENVAMALSMCEAPGSDHRARSREVLAGLGIDKPGARVEDLSVGQQQRVAVARALVTRPALVLADEPTASLDPHHAGIAIDLIRGACAQSGAALLCVSHDEVVKGRFARRLSMEDVLVREGEPAPAMGAGVAS